MLRKHFDLDESLEDLAHRAIGCCVKVHCELGPGLIEKAYDRALRLELSASGIPYETEKKYPIVYRGKTVYFHRLDLVVDQKLLLELKCVDSLHAVHTAQVRSCLKVSSLRLGLLINFNVAILPHGIKRIVL
jgi:GxxExxY protein